MEEERGFGRKRCTFGGIARLVLAEPSEIFVLEPGNVGIVVLIVLFAVPGFLAVARHRRGLANFPITVGVMYGGSDPGA